eukprot:tig00000498_g1585.t1
MLAVGAERPAAAAPAVAAEVKTEEGDRQSDPDRRTTKRHRSGKRSELDGSYWESYGSKNPRWPRIRQARRIRSIPRSVARRCCIELAEALLLHGTAWEKVAGHIGTGKTAEQAAAFFEKNRKTYDEVLNRGSPPDGPSASPASVPADETSQQPATAAPSPLPAPALSPGGSAAEDSVATAGRLEDGTRVTYATAAQIILREQRQPLHYKEIAKLAAKQGLLPDKASLHTSMFASINGDIGKQQDRSAYVRYGPGTFALKEWNLPPLDPSAAGSSGVGSSPGGGGGRKMRRGRPRKAAGGPSPINGRSRAQRTLSTGGSDDGEDDGNDSLESEGSSSDFEDEAIGGRKWTTEETERLLRYATECQAQGQNVASDEVWQRAQALQLTGHPWSAMRSHCLAKLRRAPGGRPAFLARPEDAPVPVVHISAAKPPLPPTSRTPVAASSSTPIPPPGPVVQEGPLWILMRKEISVRRWGAARGVAIRCPLTLEELLEQAQAEFGQEGDPVVEIWNRNGDLVKEINTILGSTGDLYYAATASDRARPAPAPRPP